jgi:hypothetical protein
MAVFMKKIISALVRVITADSTKKFVAEFVAEVAASVVSKLLGGIAALSHFMRTDATNQGSCILAEGLS